MASERWKPTPAHPFAEIFSLHEDSIKDLTARIKANGLREPIVLLDGKILDGRRREIACNRAGVEPEFRKFGSRRSDGKDPLEFVIDLNLHRRHLGEGERVLAAARYATAKGGRPSEKTSDNGSSAKPSQVATVSDEEIYKESTNAEAAEKFETSEAKVDRAKVVVAQGTEELQEAVADGTISVSDAAKVAKEDPRLQNAAVDDVRNGKAKSATGAIRKRKSPKKKGPKPGAPVFDDRVIDDALGKLARLFNDRANAYNQQNSSHWAKIREKMELVLAAWDQWKVADNR